MAGAYLASNAPSTIVDYANTAYYDNFGGFNKDFENGDFDKLNRDELIAKYPTSSFTDYEKNKAEFLGS